MVDLIVISLYVVTWCRWASNANVEHPSLQLNIHYGGILSIMQSITFETQVNEAVRDCSIASLTMIIQTFLISAVSLGRK